MVRRVTPSGTEYETPPYTEAESKEFYSRFSRAPIAMFRRQGKVPAAVTVEPATELPQPANVHPRPPSRLAALLRVIWNRLR